MPASAMATFEDDAGRIRLDLAGLDAGAQAVTITRLSVRPHRSGTAAIPYETSIVRGWSAASVVGSASTAFDYEYDPSDGSTYWSTTYRVTTDLGVDVSTTLRPVQSTSWVKSIQNPRRNLAVFVSTIADSKRPARVGVFEIVGSDRPVTVQDVHSSRRIDAMTLIADRAVDVDDLELLLCAGDTMFFSGPAVNTMPGPIWFAAGDFAVNRVSDLLGAETRLVSIGITEVAPPPPDVLGVAWNYQTIKDSYTSYAALKAAWPDYLELMAGPPPGEVTA